MLKKSKENLYKDLLTRGVKEVIDKNSLLRKLESGKPLKIKHGVDPTTDKLHFGYWVVYRKLKKLQEMGHEIQLLIGSFTAQIGDPEGKIDSRKEKTLEEIEGLSRGYLQQVSRVLDIGKLKIYKNNDWFGGMTLKKFLKIANNFSVWGLLARDMFQERKKMGKELRPAEFIYPILQAYDSVELQSDLTVIGSDQVFNELQARVVQRAYGQEPQDILAMEILIGLDGKNKMSQSLGNVINLDDKPEDKFGKIMSMPDNLIPHYFELLTDRDMKEIDKMKNSIISGEVNPRDLKEELAFQLILEIDGNDKATEAKKSFNKIFRRHEAPESMSEFKVSGTMTLKEIVYISGLSKSKSEAQKLIEEGAVKLDKEVVRDWEMVIDVGGGVILQVGKRKFIRLIK